MARLKQIVALREAERPRLESVRRMQQRVLEAERILAGEGMQAVEGLSSAEIGERFDGWCRDLAASCEDVGVPAQEQRAIQHFVAVTGRLRPHLLECYQTEGLPRTNNDMEGFIRGIKTRYRRISGRKNWNRYLLRYGRCIVYYESCRQPSGTGEERAPPSGAVDRATWRAARAEQQERQTEQLQQYRFRHKRAAFLAALEARWVAATASTEVLP